MKTFEENMKDIKVIQDSWLNYYDENGNLCDKDGNIIEKAPVIDEPIEDDSYTDLSYLYDEPIKEPISNVTKPVEEVITEPIRNPHRL